MTHPIDKLIQLLQRLRQSKEMFANLGGGINSSTAWSSLGFAV